MIPLQLRTDLYDDDYYPAWTPATCTTFEHSDEEHPTFLKRSSTSSGRLTRERFDASVLFDRRLAFTQISKGSHRVSHSTESIFSSETLLLFFSFHSYRYPVRNLIKKKLFSARRFYCSKPTLCAELRECRRKLDIKLALLKSPIPCIKTHIIRLNRIVTENFSV